ncbi:uncharacterized protein [Paramisgurnus dabryanus]|uniref:uncharacterized protein isoform X2 n=1 Tax=Paramisgurnus dabryanus TaxID=90735 RepID=UPI0031F3D551
MSSEQQPLNVPPRPHDLLRQQLMERLLTRLQSAINQVPLNLDYLEFLTRHELILFESFSGQIGSVSNITEALQNLYDVIKREMNARSMPIVEQETEVGPGSGHPKIVIEKEKLKNLLDTHLPVSCIEKLLCVSRRTIYRRMKEFGLSVRGSYSTVTDQELDNIISAIKSQMPNAGYRMVQGHLVSMGHRIQWWRMMASMHRVDAAGIFLRLTELGCVVRRSYSVRGPLSLVHIDTNHKLIRYNIVIFGGVDGYSRKILYLDAATNNKASTAFSIFLRSTQLYGLPSRIERLWRDVWVAVTSKYHDVLHSLEEDGLLDISDEVHLFGAHYIFVPRLRADLETFTGGWNNHPLRTEGGLSPEQLWYMGHQQDLYEGESLEELQDPGIEWESAMLQGDANGTVVVPEILCPLDDEALEELQRTLEPMEHSQSHGRDLYTRYLHIVSNQQ